MMQFVIINGESSQLIPNKLSEIVQFWIIAEELKPKIPLLPWLAVITQFLTVGESFQM